MSIKLGWLNVGVGSVTRHCDNGGDKGEVDPIALGMSPDLGERKKM